MYPDPPYPPCGFKAHPAGCTCSVNLESTPWTDRHPSVRHFQPLFRYDHLPEQLQQVSQPFAELAVRMLVLCPDGPELSAGLRKLLEAKDCAVRAAMTGA